MLSYSQFLLVLLIGATLAAPLNVLYVLAPVPVKQSSTDKTKLIAIVPLNTTRIVVKFDKPILAEIEKTSDFKVVSEVGKESRIVKLDATGDLKEPKIVSINDKKSGDSVKVMVKAE